MRGERSLKKTWDEETGVPSTEPPRLFLRPLVEALIKDGKYPKVDGEVLIVKTDKKSGIGDVNIASKQGEIHFRFVEQNDRLFVLTGELLVERVGIPPPVFKQKNTDPLVEVLYEMIRTDDYPDKDGETLVIPYDEEENMVLMTRTKTGVIADFIHLDTQLFYEFARGKVLPYKVPPTTVARENQIRKERERVATLPPEIVQQLGYKGEIEEVDTRVYCNKLVCACGNIRYIKNSDVFQTHSCKVCSTAKRKARRKKG